MLWLLSWASEEAWAVVMVWTGVAGERGSPGYSVAGVCEHESLWSFSGKSFWVFMASVLVVDFLSAERGWGSLQSRVLCISWEGEHYQGGEFPHGAERCLAWGLECLVWEVGWLKEMKLSLTFWCGCSQAFCSILFLKLLKWIPELSQMRLFFVGLAGG